MLWDIFCRVIDNYGDIGVCWRLCADLAARGEQVRLWVDDSSPLQWMAPGALQGQCPGIQVLDWNTGCNANALQALLPADVWIETFGCEIPPPFVAHRAQSVDGANTARPVWINLEYLSAEPYVERSHGLPSPVMQGPAKGWTKFFFYPGFTRKTGGLLREAGLLEHMQKRCGISNRRNVLKQLGVPPGLDPEHAFLVSLFCYEPPLLEVLLEQFAKAPTPVRLLVTHGRAAQAVRALMGEQPVRGSLHLDYLPALSQQDFDLLLWNCDLNFVRGEDSVLRALWAGNPFVWHIYPQHDLAHAAKLEAFLQQLQPGATVCSLHRAWNGLAPLNEDASALLDLTSTGLQAWQHEVQAARKRLLEMDDLVTALRQFVLKNR